MVVLVLATEDQRKVMTTKLRSVEEMADSIDDGSERLHRIAVREITKDRSTIAAVLIEGLEGKRKATDDLVPLDNYEHQEYDQAIGHNQALDTAIALIKATLDVTSEEK